MDITASFRKLPSKDLKPLGIRRWDTAPLILIKTSQDKVIALYANTTEEKDELVSMFDEETCLLLWPWPGKFKTDIFKLTRKDLELHYA